MTLGRFLVFIRNTSTLTSVINKSYPYFNPCTEKENRPRNRERRINCNRLSLGELRSATGAFETVLLRLLRLKTLTAQGFPGFALPVDP